MVPGFYFIHRLFFSSLQLPILSYILCNLKYLYTESIIAFK
jgi:hypothetical protein